MLKKLPYIFIIFVSFLSCTAIAASIDYDKGLDAIEKSLQTDINQAIEQIDAALSSESLLTAQQHSRLYGLLSAKYIYLGDFVEADKALDKALTFNPTGEVLTNIYLFKITVNIAQRNYQRAFSLLEENFSRIENYQDNSIKIKSYNRLSNVYLQLGAYDEMLRISQLALSLNQGADPRNQCFSMLLLSVAHLKLQHFDQAETLFKDTRVYCKDHGLPLIEIMSIKGQGNVLFDKGQYAAAESLYLVALERYQKFKFKVEINEIQSYLSVIYFHSGDYQQAKMFAQLVNALPNKPSNMQVKKRVNEVLSLIAGKRGHFDKAYQYQVVASALAKQLLDEQKVKENAYQMARFDSVEKNRENTSLIQDHELLIKQKDLVMKEKSSSIMISTLLVGLSVGLLLLLVSAWLQRNQFMKQAQRDGLTGIFNRRTGQEMAENEFIQAQTLGESFSVMLMDLDLFKNINDQYGHATGDWVLKKVTHVIGDMLNSTHIFTRMGGEEFAIFMPKQTENIAADLAEQIRSEVANINTRFSGHDFTVTISCGISSVDKNDLSLDPLIHRADLALYKAKHNGRNCAVCYNDTMKPPSSDKLTIIESGL
ncbi:GGDEF domain-containing protein [Shewanella psychromarinicola]|uniref:diguanylate cyclase n=1 Tax=Shewanella psychromarinicola TaxID=2487742 RepID=A0A3N4F1L5_9GAMM|nr:GGDEF domain-containing protein [Shewanella psychromarinicola]